MTSSGAWFGQAKAMVSEAQQAQCDAEDCGRLVAMCRAEKGWTRSQLADAAGVTEFDVVQCETGRTIPVKPVMTRFLRAMGHAA